MDALPGPSVLLVDDDPRNLLALESLLLGEDYRLVSAGSSNDALKALLEGEFAAIVLDVQMPEVNGIELARLIKQRKRTQHIPIIFLTAHYREDEHAMMAYEVGAVDYLTKPINPAVLRSKVNVFVDLFRKNRALTVLNTQLETQNLLLQREARERTRRIEAESARAEAEAANAAKDRFLAMLSHELRTPLTPILYSTALLEQHPDYPPDLREAVETIRRNVQLEARLIDDLLDLARIRSGKLALHSEIVDAHAILREAINVCQDPEGTHSAPVEAHLDARHPHVHADPARLQQIFWNLLTNAKKFTPSTGAITIRTTNSEKGDWLVIEVADTGIGISPDKLSGIFDAFEQAAAGLSAGLGLGLAICKALVDLQGGSIEVHSEGPDQGTLFTVKIPGVTVADAGPAPAPTQASTLSRLHILLVEDHADTAEVLRRLLVGEGCEVRLAASIAEAESVAADYRFDVLVSDIGLPDGRGTELLTRLQNHHGGPIPAIVISGFGMEEDIQKSQGAGFAEHLTKPVEFGALKQALIRVAANASRSEPLLT